MPNTIIADWLNLPSVKFHDVIIHGSCTDIHPWPVARTGLIGITLLDLPVLAVSRCHSGALDWRVARIRDLPIFEFKTYLVIEKHRINCPSCGVKVEKLEFVDL